MPELHNSGNLLLSTLPEENVSRHIQGGRSKVSIAATFLIVKTKKSPAPEMKININILQM